MNAVKMEDHSSYGSCNSKLVVGSQRTDSSDQIQNFYIRDRERQKHLDHHQNKRVGMEVGSYNWLFSLPFFTSPIMKGIQQSVLVPRKGLWSVEDCQVQKPLTTEQFRPIKSHIWNDHVTTIGRAIIIFPVIKILGHCFLMFLNG